MRVLKPIFKPRYRLFSCLFGAVGLMTISLNAVSLIKKTITLNESRPPSGTAARLMTSGAESLMIDPTALDPHPTPGNPYQVARFSDLCEQFFAKSYFPTGLLGFGMVRLQDRSLLTY